MLRNTLQEITEEEINQKVKQFLRSKAWFYNPIIMGVMQIPYEEVCKMTWFELIVLDEVLKLKHEREENFVHNVQLVEKR